MLTPAIVLAPCLWIQKSQFSHSWWRRGKVYPSLVHLTHYFNLFVLSSWLKFLENGHSVLSIFLSPGQSTWASNLDGIIIVIITVTLLYAIIHSNLQSAVRNLYRQWESYHQGNMIGRIWWKMTRTHCPTDSSPELTKVFPYWGQFCWLAST